MSSDRTNNLEKSLKNFLIVGETLDGLHSFIEYRYRYLFTSIILLASAIVAFILSLDQGRIMLFLSIVFFLTMIYFILKFKILISYGITKFRVMRIIEGDILSRFLFRSSQLIGFSDLHYEHVEQISITTPSLSMPKLYGSIFTIALGWVLLGDLENLRQLSFGLQLLVSITLLIGGMVLLLFSIPTGGVRLKLQSVSGEAMEFPEKQTPREFIDELILNCRTFLSYGAV
ncbi:MAG: hypothetical protein GPJ54_07435 [Candidatus Heimdallarchaeota archaeon]|nr:hypothetical protein [Candidatus Heimdallarchaeota archaeon]